MDPWMQATRWTLRKLSQQTLSSETGRILLQDTFLRLSGQLNLLEQLESSLNDGRSLCNNHVVNARTSVTRTSDLLDWKGHIQREKRREKTLHQTRKTFSNLQVLHRDTLHLTEQLLHSENIWAKFKEAHQSTVTSTMEQIRSRHATTMETMADLVLDLRSCSQELPSETLESFLRGRLSVQILCDHYIALNKRPRHGAVSVDCSLEPVLEEATTESKHICDAHYLVTPEVKLPTSQDCPNVTIIRPWLHHVLVEVLKNAMISSIESSEKNPPLLQVSVEYQGENGSFIQPCVDTGYWVICVQDRGRGLSDPASAFTFASSSVDKRWDRLDEQQSYAAVRSPLQSLGVGVPSSQWLMQHFGGDLQLLNNCDISREEGKQTKNVRGCTAVISIPCSDQKKEFLPLSEHQAYTR